MKDLEIKVIRRIMDLDLNKLKCEVVAKRYERIIGEFPINEGIKKIVCDNEEFFVIDQDKKRTHGCSVKFFLDKSYQPPQIQVHINDFFAAQYTYNDADFNK